MIKIYQKFFAFCGGENKQKFYLSVILGTITAFLEAWKIPAIAVMMGGLIEGNVTTRVILTSFLIMLASIILSSFTKYRSTMLQTEAGYYAASNKRIEIARHLRYLPMGYFNAHSLGQITSVTTNTMERISDVATRVVMLSTQGILTSILITVMMFFFDVRIGGIAACGIVLFFLVNAMMQRASEKISPKKIRSDTYVVEQVMEYLRGIAEVKAYRLTGKSLKGLEESIVENAKVNTDMEMTFIPFMLLQGLVTKLTGVLIGACAVWFYLNGSMQLLHCIVMQVCSFIVFASLESAGNYSALLRAIDISVDQGQEILDIEEMDIDGEDLSPVTRDMAADEIDFSYETRKIIDNVSLQIPEKTVTAFVGPSGGGKTTLCHLIARFWDVDKGRVSFDKKDVRSYSMNSLMENFSFVFQSVYLFHDTIANNIRFGAPDASMEEVIEAAKKACCHDFIMQLPDGYETMVGESGASLSGGEKQRISIARAIMKDAPVIILDEATANVDPENEKDLMGAIEALTKEKTILMIAHRLKTVRNADRIYVVDHGRIAEEGDHASLMHQNGIYKRFVSSREQAVSWKL